MRVITADEINRVLTYPALIEALREGFRADIESPLRHTHMIPQPGGSEAKYLLMPAWTRSGERLVGCKIVTVYPGNAKLNKPAVFGSYLLISGETGEPLDDLETAVREADIVSCATLSATPLIRGKWLKKGAHLDLVGAYTPKMRESDDDAVKRARVYVDTRAGAPKEGGDIAQPLKS